jgi:hypothetical protein
MPIRKTKKGWKWGSKGPFKTKEKAQQVARAAYASGYRGEGKIKRSYLEQIIREEYDLYMEEESRAEQEKIAKKEKEKTAKDAVKEIPADDHFSASQSPEEADKTTHNCAAGVIEQDRKEAGKKGKELTKPATKEELSKAYKICYGKARKEGGATLNRGDETEKEIRKARPGGEE